MNSPIDPDSTSVFTPPFAPISGSPPQPPQDAWAVRSQVCSWMVILFCAGLMMALVFFSQFIKPPQTQSPAAALVPANLTGQLALGMESFDRQQAEEMLDSLDSGPVPQRLARLVILTELDSGRTGSTSDKIASSTDESEPSEKDEKRAGSRDPLEGLARLREQMTEADYTPTDAEQKLIDATQQVIEAKLAGNPLASDSEAVQTVEKDLGFAGRVAAAWSSDDRRAGRQLRENSTTKMLGVGVFFGLVLVAAVAGLFVAAILIACLIFGLLESRWLTGNGYGFLHLEAFAVWLTTFLVAQVVVGVLAAGLGLGDGWLTLIVFYTSMFVALGWLLVRHPQPGRALREVGFTSQNVFVDLGKAVVTHLAFLPLLGLMMLLTVGLTGLVHGGGAAENPFAPPGGPSHPIQEQFDGQINTVLMLFLLAAVTAPLVEETVFRGLLYRYLRDVTDRQSIYLSVLISTLVNGFIFASIHPQGLLGIPTLMTLAASMSIAREWSGGLVAPMAIHALNNGALVGLMAVMFAN